MMRKRMKNAVWALTCLLLVSACQNPGNESSASSEAPKSMIESDAVPETAQIKITVNSNDQMRFDVKEIKVRAGQEVLLTLNHTGTTSVKMMGHNFVLLNKGVKLSEFGQKASFAGDNNYIPKDAGTDVIAHTKMLGGGESDTITFTAPEKGEYEFLCSFPGHYGIMKGKFIVI